MSNRAFKILTDERFWTVDDNNVLCTVTCLIDGNEEDVSVVWDERGAYIEHDGIKEYVLVNTN